MVVTAVHPKITFLQQLERDELPASFVNDIENWKTRSGTVKINLAIDKLPTFTANPDFDPEIHGGAIELLDDVEQLEQAYQDARFGQAARVPFSDTEIPTVVDKTLAPEGVHTVSMFSQWVPADWADDEDDHWPELEAYADRLVQHFDDVAPGFKDSVIATPDHRSEADAGGLGPDRRQHLPRGAHGGSAVPHAARGRVLGLPHADQGSLPGVVARPTPAAASPACRDTTVVREILKDRALSKR